MFQDGNVSYTTTYVKDLADSSNQLPVPPDNNRPNSKQVKTIHMLYRMLLQHSCVVFE